MIDAVSALRAELAVDVMIVTRGEYGMLLVTDDGPTEAPARAREVFDVSGAGDTVVATVAASVAYGLAWDDAIRLANIAAGVTVGKTGTVPITRGELVDALRTTISRPIPPPESKIQEIDGLAFLAAEWRSEGHIVAFTNGCFDVLHAGHVASLTWARQHCDRLIVAVNSDDSVRELKGSDRPLMAAGDRAIVLAALEAVDAVVIFGEETPLHLITAIRPDILVKGSDYREDDVVGAKEVRSWGGQVLLGPMLDGRSSTGLIERARNLD
jgi:D-beta-D-heptose 7-phosphate kinase/D-beta-D-heptose 1-phosphate adenosyltransferase